MTQRPAAPLLPAWHKVIKPHQDVRDEKFDESVYAASLGAVAEGHGSLDYRDARRFFERTFLTDGLEELLAGVARALGHAGGGHGQRVLDLRTPFGGGQTHALLAVYHLVRSGEQIAHLPAIRRVLAAADLSAPPVAQVAVVDCSQYNVLQHAVLPDGTPIRTLWGLLAYGLGSTPADGAALFQTHMAQADVARTSPGEAAIRDLLAAAGPALILLDEVIEYVIKARTQIVGDSNLGSQTITFVRDLAVAVASSQQAMLVATLVQSETNQIDVSGQATFDALEAEFRRVGREVEPVRGNDIFGVLRARLFEPLDNAKPREVGEAFETLYRANASDLPPDVGAGRTANAEAIDRAYPFHPELVSILRDRWGSLSRFQRTRGVLRFLAMVVGRLYQQKGDASLILPGDVDFDYAPIQAELRVLAGEQYGPAIGKDIVGPESHAAAVDRALPAGELRQQQFGRRLARTIMLYSIGGTKAAERGATALTLRLGVLTPDMDRTLVPLVSDVLTRLTDRCWYLYNEGGIYQFRTIENLNQVLLQREENITAEELADALRAQVVAVLNPRARVGAPPLSMRIVPWPAAPGDVPDTTTLQFVYLGREGAVTGGDLKGARAHAQALLDKATVNRTHKNRLLFLAPDADTLTRTGAQVRRLLAIAAIRKGPQGNLAPENASKLTALEAEAQSALPQLVIKAYRYVLVPGTGCTLTAHTLNEPELMAARDHADFLLRWLHDADMVYRTMSLTTLFRNFPDLWSGLVTGDGALSLEALWHALTDVCNLPRPLADDVLRTAVQTAVSNSLYGYGRGRGAALDFADDTVWLGTAPPLDAITLDAEGWLLTKPVAEGLLRRGQPPIAPPPTGIEEGAATEYSDDKRTDPADPVPPPPLPATGGYRRITLEFDFTGSDWSHIHQYILQQLLRQGAHISGRLTLSAESDSGLAQHFVDNQLPDTLRDIDPHATLAKTSVPADQSGIKGV